MQIRSKTVGGRKGWELENDCVRLFLMAGGGHISGLRVKGGPAVNPFWTPAWKTIDPWTYTPRDAGKYAIKLLAAISGHNLCLGFFGDPSPEEVRAGLGTHGEAPVARWRMLGRTVSKRALIFRYGCDLPIAQMRFERQVRMTSGSPLVRIREKVTSLARRDLPFTMCQHATFGPPFVEPGVTLFDMPATKGHTFPGTFSDRQRLKSATPFTWPMAPGVKGRKVDLRQVDRTRSSDFSAHLMDPRREQAWFSAVNPRQGLLVAYAWKRADFPWVGMWEENRARTTAPWNSRSLTRGMEFSNTPFPMGLRKAVDLGRFHGRPAFAWLPARATLTFDYALLATTVSKGCTGVSGFSVSGEAFNLDLR